MSLLLSLSKYINYLNIYTPLCASYYFFYQISRIIYILAPGVKHCKLLNAYEIKGDFLKYGSNKLPKIN